MIITTIFGFSLIFSTTVSANSEKLFSDVDQSTKYSQAIEYLKNNGIVGGYPDGSFQPEKTLNRAELLKILIESSSSIPLEGDTGGVEDEEETANPLNLPYQGDLGNCFPDVKDEWFAPYVCYAKEQGIVKGYPDGSFQPANEVNFVEGLKMMLGVLEIDYTENEVWYQNIVEKATEKRLIPFDITNFNQKLQRGQMLDMMTRGIKDKNGNGELAWYLQNAGDCEVSYVSILENRNIEKECFMSITLHALGNKEWTELVGKNTTELNLSYRSLESVDGLENLRNLTKLDLGANELQDISFLADLTNLTELDLRDNWLWDISPVAGLTNLEKLNLNLNIMGDPAPLGSLTNLKWLGLYKNQYLYDISALDSLENLEYIDLGLAELNEGELERFTENHPKTEIENVLKPWVGMKGFDLDTNMLVVFDAEQFDITTDEGQETAEKIFQDVSNEIWEELKGYAEVTQDDLEHSQIPLLSFTKKESSWFRMKYVKNRNTKEVIWKKKVNSNWIQQKLFAKSEVTNVDGENEILDQVLEDYYGEFSRPIFVDDVINVDFYSSKMSPLNVSNFFNKVSVQIAQDEKRRGSDVSDEFLKGEKVYFSLDGEVTSITNIDVFMNEWVQYWKINVQEGVKYLMRYPEIETVGGVGAVYFDI